MYLGLTLNASVHLLILLPTPLRVQITCVSRRAADLQLWASTVRADVVCAPLHKPRTWNMFHNLGGEFSGELSLTFDDIGLVYNSHPLHPLPSSSWPFFPPSPTSYPLDCSIFQFLVLPHPLLECSLGLERSGIYTCLLFKKRKKISLHFKLLSRIK